MIEFKSKKSRAAFYAGTVVLVIGLIFFLLRGPYLSNFTKRLIIPALENATMERVIIGQAAINLFPFYIQAKSLKVFDEDGNQLLWITKSRAYIDLSGFFVNEIRIRKLWCKEPRLEISVDEIEKVIKNVENYVSKSEDTKLKVTLHNVELIDGELTIDDKKEGRYFSGTGASLNIAVKNNLPHRKTTAEFLFKEARLKLSGLNEVSGPLEGSGEIEKDRVEITGLNVKSSGSTVDLTGELLLSPDGRPAEGELNVNAGIHVLTFNELFGLKNKKDGALSFNGSVDIVPGKDKDRPDIVLDLKTDSSFYLETLMEIIEVEENISGLVSVKGDIKGKFPDVVGKGSATLRNAVFDTFPLDDAAGEIEYGEGRFALHDFIAHTYDGELQGDAHIEIQDGDYSVTADARDIDSLKLFRFIEWEPGFPAGRLNGNFILNHEIDGDFEIAAVLDYMNKEQDGGGGELIERLRTITASLKLKGDMLTFDEAAFYTSRSKLFLTGDMDFEQDTFSLDLQLETDEVNDLTAPYYEAFNTAGTFIGSAGGSLSDPEISGRIYLDGGSLHGIPVSGAYAMLKYRTGLLSVEKLELSQNDSSAELNGLVEFRGAEEFFALKDPYFKAAASLKDVGVKQFAGLFGKGPQVDGTAEGMISFEGDTKKYTGIADLVITDSVIYGQNIMRTELKGKFGPDRIDIHSLNIYHNESALAAEGTLYYDGKFDLALSSDDFDSCDINRIAGHPLGVRFGGLKISGTGTMEEPDIEFSGRIAESYLNEKELGSGNIEGTFKGRDLRFKGLFAGGLLSAEAEVSFSGRPSWNADIDIRKGRYDFLLSGLTDKIPEDISLTLKGAARIRPTAKGHTFESKFGYLGLSAWGYELVNDKDVVLEVIENELFLRSFSLSGNNTDIHASGSVKLYESYDVVLIGNVALASLSSVSEKIGSITGQGAYITNITGDWDSPQINGEISVKDAMAVLTDMKYKIGPLNGVFFFDRGKVTFDSVTTGFAGGTVDISGAGYLDKLSVDKLYVSASLSDIKVRPLERVNVSLGGNLFYETSREGSSLTGNIDINKAKYEKDIKFDKLILGLKGMENGKAQYPEFIQKTALNIHVEGKENIIIDNNIATTPVRISINLMGTVGGYGLIGKVDALGGSIYFRNNEFTILKGSSVEFISAESVVPVFHILAESFISDYYVKLSLDGTMDQFNLSLFSDPPLSETDILTLLTFGEFRKGVKGFESGLAASEAASILTGDLQEAVETKFRNLAGFDRFEIGPHSAASGAFGTKVTIGKRLIEDKLSVIYSTSVGTTEDHIIKLKYNISKSVALVGSRDEIGSAGVDLKYRFEFK